MVQAVSFECDGASISYIFRLKGDRFLYIQSRTPSQKPFSWPKDTAWEKKMIFQKLPMAIFVQLLLIWTSYNMHQYKQFLGVQSNELLLVALFLNLQVEFQVGANKLGAYKTNIFARILAVTLCA